MDQALETLQDCITPPSSITSQLSGSGQPKVTVEMAAAALGAFISAAMR